ncbi:MAG: 50S ribosomal protein L25 [Dehalococcoidales bacterium]|nr:50S ribosomal protein L25 [Dehalococcoidales bacterium]
MKGPELKATTRDILGKKTKQLRRQGITPTHLFGRNLESLTLQCSTTEVSNIIAQVGTTKIFNLKVNREQRHRRVLIRKIQHDPLGSELLHVDFYQISQAEKLKADIPIILIGEAPAMKIKGRSLTQALNNLSIECLPDKLPSEIRVDLSPLGELGQTIHVKDIMVNPEITVITDPEQLVVKVSETAAAKAEEEIEAITEVTAAEAPTPETESAD